MGRRNSRRNGSSDAFSVGPTAVYEDYTAVPGYASGIPKFPGSNRGHWVAVLISPKTLLPAAVSKKGNSTVVVHTLDNENTLVEGFWGSTAEARDTGCKRQHMMPGIRGRSYVTGGFGPLAYYGGALLSGGCIVSFPGERTAEASRAWANFNRLGISHQEDVFAESEEPDYEYEHETVTVYDVRVELDEYINNEVMTGEDLNSFFEDDDALETSFTVSFREHEVRDVFYEGLSSSFKEQYEYSSCGEDEEASGFPLMAEVIIRRDSVEDDSPAITDILIEPGARFTFSYCSESRSEEVYVADVMSADSVMHSSGLVVWADSTLSDLGNFRPPPPEVLGHMNPRSVSKGWFRSILRFCAGSVSDPILYLNTVRETARKAQGPLFNPKDNMFLAINQVVGQFQEEPESRPLHARVRKNPGQEQMSLAEWTAMSAQFEDEEQG